MCEGIFQIPFVLSLGDIGHRAEGTEVEALCSWGMSAGGICEIATQQGRTSNQSKSANTAHRELDQRSLTNLKSV